MRRGSVVLTSALVGVLVLMTAAPAHAASRYRFWSYWYAAAGASSWTYAQVGPAGHRVDDGAVEGWRFTVAVPNPSAPPPRISAATAFDRICGGTERPEGKDRVALVVDFGTSADAPKGEHPPTSTVRGTCVVVPDRSTGLAVLGEARYAVRQNSAGLVCGLQGYPRTECGVTVSEAPSSTPKPSGVPAPSRSTSKAPQTRSPAVVQPSETGSAGAPGAAPSGSAAASPSGTASAPGSSLPSPNGSDSGAALDVGAPPDEPGGSSGSPLALLLGVAAVVAVSGAAYWRSRTRRGET